jgi:hypothetical protein
MEDMSERGLTLQQKSEPTIVWEEEKYTLESLKDLLIFFFVVIIMSCVLGCICIDLCRCNLFSLMDMKA